MAVYILLLVAISYLAFIFISDLINPFAQVNAPLRRRRWRFGRATALSSLAAGTVALILLTQFSIHERGAVAIYIALTALFALPSAIKYKKSALWQ